jgi:hypothetical protein
MAICEIYLQDVYSLHFIAFIEIIFFALTENESSKN